MKKKRILVIMGRYLPGYRDGGPVRTIANLTDCLGKEYEFRILTCDRDHGDTAPYPDIRVNDWNQVGNALVYYVPPGGFSFSVITRLSAWADMLFICGCFNDYAIRSLILKRMGKIKKPMAFALMGLFSPSAFRSKYLKKKAYISVCNISGVFRRVYFSASSAQEIADARTQIRAGKERFFVAENLPRMVKAEQIIKKKKQGRLNLVWFSRISRIKNLLGAAEVLHLVKANVKLSVYGPVQDEKYWEECRDLLDRLPENVSWEYCGEVKPDSIVDMLKPYHVFLFLTFGENFGHVIQEALSAGCACVLSDQTPWKDLQNEGVGFVYPLDDKNAFAAALEYYASLSEAELQKVSDLAHAYALKVRNERVEHTGYRRLFDTLCGEGETLTRSRQ